MANSSAEMAIFQRVAERGSFAGAADDVGLSPSAVAKLVTRLETRLGVRLINRTTRRLSLTTEGEIYLERAHEILAAIETAEAEISSARLTPRGHLRVHALPFIAVRLLAPVLPDFLTRYPQITFDFMVTNRIVDIIGENVDISLRIGALNDSALVARKIVALPRIVCASPSYLARHCRSSSRRMHGACNRRSRTALRPLLRVPSTLSELCVHCLQVPRLHNHLLADQVDQTR